MELGIEPQIKLIALNHPEHPDQPGIVVAEPLIGIEQIPSWENIEDGTGSIDDARTAPVSYTHLTLPTSDLV